MSQLHWTIITAWLAMYDDTSWYMVSSFFDDMNNTDYISAMDNDIMVHGETCPNSPKKLRFVRVHCYGQKCIIRAIKDRLLWFEAVLVKRLYLRLYYWDLDILFSK